MSKIFKNKSAGDASPPPRPSMDGKYKGVTFKTAEDVPFVYTGTFEDCEFEMDTLERRNFAGAKFVDCNFPSGFKFIRCNLHSATGIENVDKEQCLVARSRPTPPAHKETEIPKKKR